MIEVKLVGLCRLPSGIVTLGKRRAVELRVLVKSSGRVVGDGIWHITLWMILDAVERVIFDSALC